MKKILLLILIMLTLTACTQTETAPTVTNSPVPATATNTPEPMLTPTPMPYYLENGTLYDLVEATGEYVVVGENVAEITTVEGVIVGVDSGGVVVMRREGSTWVEVEKESVWRYVAPAQEWGGDVLKENVDAHLEYLEKEGLLPTNENVTRIITEDGEPLPFGQVNEKYEMDLGYGRKQEYSMILGGVVDWQPWVNESYGLGEVGSSALVMFLPDDANNIDAGGQVVTVFMRNLGGQYAHDYTFGLLPDGVMTQEHASWVFEIERWAMEEAKMIQWLRRALNEGGKDLLNSQVSLGLLLRYEGYWSESGWLGGNGGDTVGNDGVSDFPSTDSFLDAGMIAESRLIVFPEKVMSPELYSFLTELGFEVTIRP